MSWRPIDIIVLIIIFTLTMAVLAFMLRPYITGTQNPPETAQMATDLFGALIAIVAVYIGSSIEKFNSNDKKQ